MLKFFSTTSLVLPLVAAASAAHAGSTITDRSYWPSEARTSQANTVRSNPNAAFASVVYAPVVSVQTRFMTGNAEHYRGGPKGR
jgi:hypothetical protein